MYGAKKWYQSRTVWVNVLTIIASVAATLNEWLVAGDFSAAGMSLLVLALANLGLRFITTEGIEA